MAIEPPQLCVLRPEITNLDFSDQLALILGCHVADAETYRRLEAKHAALVNWIERK